MKTHILKYLAAFTAPALAFVSFTQTGLWCYCLLIYAFILVPLIELVLRPDEHNMSQAEEDIAKNDRLYDYLLYLIVPTQFALLFYYLHIVSSTSMPLFDLVGKTISMGILCGVLGINVAHELGHRRKRYEQWMAKALLLSSSYMHFFIEHNRGHHRNVSTHEDPASSRRGEILYFFWIRSVVGSYFSAWHLEAQRLKTVGKSVLSFSNEMIWYQVIQLAFMAGIFLAFGGTGLIYFLIVSVIGFLLLETVNYIEHYGLQRKQNTEGIYERVLPVHSWNSNHAIGRILLFELSRHSDHHYRASRKYQVLRHFEDAPQMPTGYPGMMVLSLFPPVWFYVMHRHIDRYKQEYAELA